MLQQAVLGRLAASARLGRGGAPAALSAATQRLWGSRAGVLEKADLNEAAEEAVSATGAGAAAALCGAATAQFPTDAAARLARALLEKNSTDHPPPCFCKHRCQRRGSRAWPRRCAVAVA